MLQRHRETRPAMRDLMATSVLQISAGLVVLVLQGKVLRYL
jgi:hypothetical protein